MAIDWKDALGALREGFDEPAESHEDLEIIKEPEKTQTKPLYLFKDRKGRNGKIATLVEGFECQQEIVEEVAALLKRKLGTGGSTRQGEILIQGERTKEVAQYLKELGYKVKISG